MFQSSFELQREHFVVSSMSSFRSRSPPLCFERVGSQRKNSDESSDLTHLSDSNPHLDDPCCCSSSTSINLDYDPFLKSVTKPVSNREIKETITSSVGAGSSGLMSTLSSVVKRLSTAELEHMIQNKLGKVIDGHRYTSWLRKEINESDAQLAKYKNRIEVLQKHVNDLSTVIQNHIQNSEGSNSPPRKLTRNVGLQVRIKETKGSELCSTSSNCQTPVDAALLIDHRVNYPLTQDNLGKAKQNDDEEHGKIENKSSIEIDLTHSDSDESPSSHHQSPRTLTSPVQVVLVSADMPAIVSHCKSDGEKSGDNKERSGLPGLGTLSPSCIHPGMDVTTNCRISSTDTTLRLSNKAPCMESMSSSTFDVSSGTCPVANNSSPNKSVGFICPKRIAVASLECHPSAAGPSSGQQSNNADKGFYSNGDRKRRLPCSITSIDASTIASVEKYHKSIKDRWYDSNEPPSEIARPRCMSQSEVHHQNHPWMIVATQSVTQHQPVITQNPCQMNNTMRLPIPKLIIQHGEFAKKVESIGLYHKWKLPIPPYISLPPTQSPGRQSSVISSKQLIQNHQQPPNIRTWIPRSNCLDSLFSSTKQCCAPDANEVSVHWPDKPLHDQPINHQQSELQQRCNKTHCTNPSTQLSHGPVKKIIPDLIAISKEDPSLLPASPTVNEWKMNLITTHFKPILMLTRSEGGIRVKWTIPNLTRSQQVGQIESYVLYARKENGLVPSSETSWLRVAVFAALPLPMSYVFKELTPGYRYYFRIGTNFRGRSDVRAHEIPFSEPASMMM